MYAIRSYYALREAAREHLRGRWGLKYDLDEVLISPGSKFGLYGGMATVLVLGDTCTRGCSFCSVKAGTPDPPDRSELV